MMTLGKIMQVRVLEYSSEYEFLLKFTLATEIDFY